MNNLFANIISSKSRHDCFLFVFIQHQNIENRAKIYDLLTCHVLILVHISKLIVTSAYTLQMLKKNVNRTRIGHKRTTVIISSTGCPKYVPRLKPNFEAVNASIQFQKFYCFFLASRNMFNLFSISS